jgi:hypothetical protein
MAVDKALITSVSKKQGFVSDADNTLYRGRWVEGGLGYKLIREAWDAHNYGLVFRGVWGAAQVKLLLRKEKLNVTREVDGLKLFYGILVRNGLGDCTQMAAYARSYISQNYINSAQCLLNQLPNGMPKIIVTLGGDTGAGVSKWLFNFNGAVSNTDLFYPNGRLAGIKVDIRTGEDKARAAWKAAKQFGIELSNCAVMGDGLADIQMLMDSGLPIASPYADPEVLKAVPNIIQLEKD